MRRNNFITVRPTKATNIHVTNPGLGRLHLEQHNIAGGYCSNGSSLSGYLPIAPGTTMSSMMRCALWLRRIV